MGVELVVAVAMEALEGRLFDDYIYLLYFASIK
jgi:hypothetical protein